MPKGPSPFGLRQDKHGTEVTPSSDKHGTEVTRVQPARLSGLGLCSAVPGCSTCAFSPLSGVPNSSGRELVPSVAC